MNDRPGHLSISLGYQTKSYQLQEKEGIFKDSLPSVIKEDDDEDKSFLLIL